MKPLDTEQLEAVQRMVDEKVQQAVEANAHAIAEMVAAETGFVCPGCGWRADGDYGDEA